MAAAAAAAAALVLVAMGVGAVGRPWPCDSLPPLSEWDAPSVWWEANDSYYVQLRLQEPPLRVVLRVAALAQREAQAQAQELCVALVECAAHGAAASAAASLAAQPLRAAAVVRLPAHCAAPGTRPGPRWSGGLCGARVWAPAGLVQLPLFRLAPSQRAFWLALREAASPHPWLRLSGLRLRVQGNGGSGIRPEWVSLLRLPSLDSLELVGNDWAAEEVRLPPMPALRDLRLHNNSLTDLPHDFVQGSPSLEMLTLAHNRLTHLPKSITELKELKLLDLTNPLPMGQSFSVTHISKIKNLRILGLENQKLEGDVLPIFLKPALMFLNVSGCGLKSLEYSNESRVNSTDLLVLDLSYNKLESISSDFLSKFYNLVKLAIRGNGLRSFGDTSSLVLPHLEHLDISQNHLKSLPTLTHSSKMKSFKARDNIFETFSEDFWYSFPLLKELDLSQNRLREVPSLQNHEELVTLDLSSNEIKVLQRLSFGRLKNLNSINMSNNLLIMVDSKVLANFEALKNIDFSQNRLWHISLVSESVEFVNLSNNHLTDLPELDVPSLYHISLMHNLITVVNFTDVNCSKLREVDLSWNKISIADLGNLSFDEVDLSFNLLRWMPTNSFESQLLKIEGNPLNRTQNVTREVSSSIWDLCFFWVLLGVCSMFVITCLFLVGIAILFRKLKIRSEPLELSSVQRWPSIRYE